MVDFLILGAGGHAMTLAEILSKQPQNRLKGFLETEEYLTKLERPKSIMGLPIFWEEDPSVPKTSSIVIGVGQIKSSSTRAKLFNWALSRGFQLPPVVADSAIISSESTISSGAQILNKVVLGPGTFVGKGTIVNTGAIVEHGVSIGEFSHVSTGVVVNGEAKIGTNVFIGSGSVLRNGIQIADNSFVPMGSVVAKDLEA